MAVVHSPGLRTVARVPIERRPSGLDLGAREAAIEHVPHAVAHDRQHVAILGHVELVGQIAVARHDHRAAFVIDVGNRELDDRVERREQALHRAAALEIDDGVASRC